VCLSAQTEQTKAAPQTLASRPPSRSGHWDSRIPFRGADRVALEHSRHNLLTDLRDSGDQIVNLAAEHGIGGRSGPGEWDQGGLDPDDRVEDEPEVEGVRADAGMGHVQLVAVRLRVGDELLEIVRRKIASGCNQQRKLDYYANRLEVGLRPVREVWVKGGSDGMGAHVAHKDGVAIRVGALGAERPGRATCTRDVLDDDLLPKYVCSAATRVATSVAPPAANGTINVTVRVG
jgi:hypothetical protein